MLGTSGRRGAAASVMVVVAVLLPGVSGVAAAPVEACTPTPKVASSFCITSDVSVNGRSNAPVKLALELANTSPGTTSATRLSNITVAITPGTAGPFGITPSAQLPQGLVVAGSPSCTSPAFTDCAGHGTAKITVSGLGAGHYDGTFGVRRITNVNPPAAGARAQYAGILDICVPYGGDTCFFELQQELAVTIPEVAGPDPLSLTIPTRFTGSIGGGGDYDASVHTFSLAISGASNQIYNGSSLEPTTTARIFSTPQVCGTATSTVTGRTIETSPRSVATPHPHTITHCPVARFITQYDAFTATLDGTTSTAATGRDVRRWIWTFGDGTSRTTTSPVVAHTYDDAGNHQATLQVRDSAGALSKPITKTVRGTTTTLTLAKTAQQVQASGAVSPDHSGTVTVVLERKSGDTFQPVTTKKPALSADSEYGTVFARPAAGECRMRATFRGDEDHLGSRATKSFAC